MTAKSTRRPKGEGTIFQRADGKWIGRLTYEDPQTGLRKRSQVSAPTKKGASEELRKIRERVDAKQPPRDDKALFGTFAEQWVATSLEVSDRKQSTKTLYAGLTRSHIIDSDLGRSPMGRIKASTVERFIAHLRRKGLSPSTVRQVYTVARGIGDAAVRDRLLVENPFGQVKRPQVEHKEAAVLSVPQARQLVDVAGESRYAALFELLINTGLRRGEALALKWSDVDLEGPTMRVRKTLVRQGGELVRTAPKTKKSDRTIPLSSAALDVLRRVKRRNAEDRLRAGTKWRDTGYVFVTEFGEPCDPRNALRALQAAAERAGLPGVGLHTLRHTAATIMLNSGIPMATVSRIMGHASIAVTVDLYGHVSPDVARDAFDALGAAWTASADQ